MRDKLEFFDFDKEAILIICLFGTFFGLGALLHELSLKLFLTGFLFGAFLGFAGLPFIDSEKWKPMPKVCSMLGFTGAIIFAVTINQQIQHMILFGVFGTILGYFAPVWAKHI